jgi:hypothetical protein
MYERINCWLVLVLSPLGIVGILIHKKIKTYTGFLLLNVKIPAENIHCNKTLRGIPPP